jgi:hypothetical protein
MKRRVWMSAVAATVLLAAGGGSEVVVHAQFAAEGDEPARALRDLQVRVLPYDRDEIFRELEAAYPVPQPEIPEELLQLEQQIAAAQEEWQRAESRWITVRDSLQRLSSAMRGMNPRSGEYLVMFRSFQQLEGQESGLRRQNEQAFERFTGLQQRYVAQADEIRVARENWADDAYAPVDSIILVRLREARRDEAVDTTDAQGVTRIRVRPGTWWVHARYDLPYQELYWNVRVEVPRGEQATVQLTRENAQVRPKL